jgi:ketosteroid isomerase-like protein
VQDDPRDEIWNAVNAIYAAYLAGDRAAIDAHIADDATLWDSMHETLIRGKAELGALRDARPANGPKPVDLRASDPVIDVYGDVAVARHLLTVAFASQPEQRIRNTGVWRKLGGRWQVVHNHEDVLA